MPRAAVALPDRRAQLHAGAALGLAALLGQGRAAAAAPIRLRDALSREVLLPRPAQRIVTIFSSNVELVAALGLVERIVGVEEYTRFPPEVAALPRVGGRLGFSVDAVVAQRPDLVIVTPARQAANQLVDPMERIGVPVMVLLSRSLDEVLGNVRLVAQAAGVPARGAALAASLAQRLHAVDQGRAGQRAPRALMITGRLGNGMLLVARPGTYTNEAMLRAGALHALPGTGRLAQVSPEAALACDPDLLLFAGAQAGLDELTRRPGWRDMRAVRAQRAVTVSRAEFLIPGPRTFDGIESLARQVLLWQRKGFA